MDNIDVRQLVSDWVKRDGEVKVTAELNGKLPLSSILRLVKGRYPSDPKTTLRWLLITELKRAGLIDEAAS